eukprot:531790-Hanusia_phi.AAC.1
MQRRRPEGWGGKGGGEISLTVHLSAGSPILTSADSAMQSTSISPMQSTRGTPRGQRSGSPPTSGLARKSAALMRPTSGLPKGCKKGQEQPRDVNSSDSGRQHRRSKHIGGSVCSQRWRVYPCRWLPVRIAFLILHRHLLLRQPPAVFQHPTLLHHLTSSVTTCGHSSCRPLAVQAEVRLGLCHTSFPVAQGGESREVA